MFPTYSEVDRRMIHLDNYEFYYKGHPCHIWLDRRGMFHAQNGGAGVYSGMTLREVMDKLYNELKRGIK